MVLKNVKSARVDRLCFPRRFSMVLIDFSAFSHDMLRQTSFIHDGQITGSDFLVNLLIFAILFDIILFSIFTGILQIIRVNLRLIVHPLTLVAVLFPWLPIWI